MSLSPDTLASMRWRDFDSLSPTDIVEEWLTPNARGYSEHWVTRIVTEKSMGDSILHPEWDDKPIIEFYSIDGKFGQFVSSYYVDTLAGRPFDVGLDLAGDVPSWKMEASHISGIIKWAVDACAAAGMEL